MRAQPTARILLTIRQRDWTVYEALAELIDNAFGERRGAASEVDIVWSAKDHILNVVDNGRGMNQIIDLFTLGKGMVSGAGDIGLYGVGGSEALLWLSDDAIVTTLRRGRVASGEADWARCVARNEFPDINTQWREATVDTCPTILLERHHGTLIQLRLKPKLRIRPDQITERLSRLFAVALRSGRRITWHNADPEWTTQQLHAWDPGPFEDTIDTTIVIDNGLSAVVKAGRVDGLSIANSKLAVNYIYRQIKETSAGFGRPIQGACGYVDLSADWLPYLTTTKNNINEDGREYELELMAAIAVALKPLIDKLAEAKREQVFSNVKINLIHRFQRGFRKRLEPEGVIRVRGYRGGTRKPRRKKLGTYAAEIDIKHATNAEINGLLCHVEIAGDKITAFINKEHPQVIAALEAEPVNQMLLEQVLVAALAKKILQENVIVELGVMSQTQLQNLYDRYDGSDWEVFPHLMRVLTDGAESMVDETLPTVYPS